MSRLTYIFVHGLSGWGSYDRAYRRMPYWGMRGGDLMPYLRGRGFDCYAASVAPTGSAWDRACELYAQIAGTRVDYGEAHSRKYRHDRFDRDFSDCPLIPSWDSETGLVLLGHSFGGATVRLFSELLANGDEEERKAAKKNDLSPLHEGGMRERIHSIVTLASPMNGTTAYDLFQDPQFDPESVRAPRWSEIPSRMMKMVRPKKDGRDDRDYADYDMHLDHAMEMNERITTLPDVYYFSVPCSHTAKQADGKFVPRAKTEPLFVKRAYQIGAYVGKTQNGFPIENCWRESDGLVNTVSAMAPHNAPSQPLDRNGIRPGIWNVFPTVAGDHMWLQGGLMYRHDIRGFYGDLLSMIEAL